MAAEPQAWVARDTEIVTLSPFCTSVVPTLKVIQGNVDDCLRSSFLFNHAVRFPHEEKTAPCACNAHRKFKSSCSNLLSLSKAISQVSVGSCRVLPFFGVRSLH